MPLFKKIMTKIFWGLVLSVGYVFLVSSFLNIGENQKWYQLYVELCLLGFFTGFISALSSKPFKRTKIIYCSLVGIIGIQNIYLFFRSPLSPSALFNIIIIFPFFLFVPFLMIAIVIGIIDKSPFKMIVGSIGSLIALVVIYTIVILIGNQVFGHFVEDWYYSHPPAGGWGLDFGFSAMLRKRLFSSISYPINWIVAYYDIFIAGILYILGIGVDDLLAGHKKR